MTVGGEALILENDEASRSMVLHNAFPVNILFRKYWPELGEAIQIKTSTHFPIINPRYYRCFEGLSAP